MREAWLYSWGGLGLYALILYAMALIFTVGTVPGTSFGLVVFVTAMAASFLGFLMYCRVFKAGLWAGNSTGADLAFLLAPAVVVAICSVLDPRWTLPGLLAPWIAVSTLAVNMARRHAVPMLMVGAAIAAGQILAARALDQGAASQAWSLQLPGIGPTLFMTALTPAMVFFTVWWWGIIVKLDHARKNQADLAVARERLRFASDLHDIQGHHLQVIALKAELAERLLERDVAGAKTQLQETRQEARTALEQTRALVQGLRQVSLDQELTNAAEVLESAGISSTHHVDATPASPETRHLLGLVVREATTNILRHSHAKEASYHLNHMAHGAWRLTVYNDGAARDLVSPSPESGDDARDKSVHNPAVRQEGTGLAGLSERLDAAGGELLVTHAGGTFTVVAVLFDPEEPGAPRP